MITIKELSIDNESAEKIIDLIKKHEPKIWNVLKVELKQALTLTDFTELKKDDYTNIYYYPNGEIIGSL